MDYADAVVALIDKLDEAITAAEENGLTNDEIISEFELKLYALKEQA